MSTGMRILLYLVSLLIPIAGFIIGAIYYTKPDRDFKHVGKICIVLGVVGLLIGIVFTALFYVMFLGFGADGNTPAIMVISKTRVSGGFKITLSAPTQMVAWTDLTILLSDDSGAQVSWGSFTSQDLTNPHGSSTWHSGSAKILDSMEVWLNITDIAGNGLMSSGDYFTLISGFSASTTYTLTLLFEPTGGAMLSHDFTG